MSIPPVFVCGAGRSGTTLAVDLLGMHPQLSPVYETDFVLRLAASLFSMPRRPVEEQMLSVSRIMEAWSRPLPHRPHQKRVHERYHHGPHHVLFSRAAALTSGAGLAHAIEQGDVLAGLRAMMVELFAVHAEVDGKPAWINKTPAYVRCLPLLTALFPDCRIVVCVRDGHDVAASILTRAWGPGDAGAAGRWWAEQVALGRDFAKLHPAQVYEVAYEDLVTDRESVLDGVWSWLRLHKQDTPRLLAGYHGAAPDPARIGTGASSLSLSDRGRFDREAALILAPSPGLHPS